MILYLLRLRITFDKTASEERITDHSPMVIFDLFPFAFCGTNISDLALTDG